ncbi:hypothetical protein [Malonomonas rubra]|uniref:hypothetical protein n=1 Tax=Malonomonas rubra TaxID=57040 RepID=UPI0026F32886|nr:hypothetical protein [Malonomonas rubra]
MYTGENTYKTVAVWLVLICGVILCAPQFVRAAETIQAMRSVEVLAVDESGAPLRFPSGVSYDREGDELYVTSPQKNKLVVLTPDYFPYLSIGSGRGLRSISKTYIKNGLLYACVGASTEEPRPHIAIYDMAFLPVREIYFPDHKFFSPLDLVVADDGTIYAVGINGTGVMVLSPEGEFLRWIEPHDEILGIDEKAPILAIDRGIDGNLYLLSEAMGRVYVYDQRERYLYKFGEKGGEPGKLSRPRGIAVDDFRQRVYLVDYQRHTLSIYAQTGEYLFEVGGLGGGRGWFYYPSDIVVDGNGRVVVADTFNHRLQVFEFVSRRGFGGEEQPAGQTEVEPEVPVKSVTETAPPKNLLRIRKLKDPIALDSADEFVILTAMTKDRQETDLLALQLLRKDYPAMTRGVERAKSGEWFQVLVGPYRDPLDAYQVAERLRKEELLPAMLKTRGEPLDIEVPGETDDQRNRERSAG